MAEFSFTNSKLSFPKLSQFFTIKDLYLHMKFDIVDLSETSIIERIHK